MKNHGVKYATVIMAVVSMIGILAGCAMSQKNVSEEDVGAVLDKVIEAYQADEGSDFTKAVNNVIDESIKRHDTILFDELIKQSDIRTNDASNKAYEAYGTDSYETLYEEYADWSVVTAVFKSLKNELEVNGKTKNLQISGFDKRYSAVTDDYELDFQCDRDDVYYYVNVTSLQRTADILSWTNGSTVIVGETDKDLQQKMNWLGSGAVALISGDGERTYFFYADDIVSPKARAVAEKAGTKGLNSAMGWNEDETARVLEELSDKYYNAEDNERLASYFYSGDGSFSPISYFDVDYEIFNRDMNIINEVLSKCGMDEITFK